MTQAIVTYLNAVIDTVGRVDERYCMAELRSDGTTTVPYIYVGNGKVKPISIDGGSLSYWRISGAVPPMEQIASQYGKPRLSATYPLRLVIIARRADSTIDDGFMPTRLAEDIANALTGSHPDLKLLLKANTVSVSAGYDVNITGVWADEFKGTGVNDPNYTRTIMALSVSVTVIGDRACWENECDYDPDILHLFDFCQSGTVARLTPAQVACLQAIAEDANWELYNTNGTLLSTGSIPSGDTDSIVAPDATVLRDGVPFGTVASGDSIDVPSAGSDLVIMGDLIETLYPSSPIDFNFTVNGVPQSVGYDVGTQTIQASAPDATVTVNATPFGTSPSGGTLNVPVVNGGSNPVGSKQGSDWVIDNNATFINGTQVTDQEAEVDANIFVTLDGTQSGTWNAGLQTWEVTSAPTTPKTTAKLMKTGQTVSYVTGDDGDLERGRSVDFLTLAENNYFGNTNRFTDTLGGQTYTNNIVLDWSTFEEASGDVMGYFRVLQGAATWTTAISNCLAFTAGAFVSGWYLPNVVELLSIMNLSQTLYLTYGPFSIGGSFLNSSTTYPAATAQSWMIVGNASTPLTVRTKSVATSYIPVRRFNISEL